MWICGDCAKVGVMGKVGSNEGYEELPFYTFDLALVGFFIVKLQVLGKPLLIMNNDTTTSENSIPFIGTDKIEEIPKVISERNNLNQVIL